MSLGPLAAVSLAVATVVGSPFGATAQISEPVTVTVNPSSTDVVLGESFDITIDVANTGAEATPPLVIHVDITDPTSQRSVDPEDWTSTLSRTVGAVEAGRTDTLTWTLQPISPGTFSVYAVALSPGIDNSSISNIVDIDVADQRSLDPGGDPARRPRGARLHRRPPRLPDAEEPARSQLTEFAIAA